MDDLITRQEIEEEVEEINSEPEREILRRIYRKRHNVLLYSIFLFLYTIRGLVKRILNIIQGISFVMLGMSILVYWLEMPGPRTVEFRGPFIITTIIFIILFCSSVALSWFYDILLFRLSPPNIRFFSLIKITQQSIPSTYSYTARLTENDLTVLLFFLLFNFLENL